jgi:hypothetical protein
MMLVLRLVLILFAGACLTPDSLVAAEKQESGVFTGIHSKEGVGGRPNTARITDGKTFVDITEQEYRERGYIPAFNKLPMLIVRRLPVRIPVPSEQDK